MERTRTLAWWAATAAVLLAAGGVIAQAGPGTDTVDTLAGVPRPPMSVPPSAVPTVTALPVGRSTPTAEPSARTSVTPPAPRQREKPNRTATGTVSDEAGRPLADIRILTSDAQALLGSTDEAGRFAVPCRGGVVFAPYAFGPDYWRGPARQEELSPGLGNRAFRTRRCGRDISVVMPAGGIVEGTADAPVGATVWLSRVVGGSDGENPNRFGSFGGKVRDDGTYRLEGLATGRYSIESSYEGFQDEATFVDVHEGRTADGSYTFYQDPAVCYEQPDSADCYHPSPTPQPEPTATS